ncbi:hypothetical protein UFOVP556_5 [uncultured Caudovirales phage]|uniref:Uncharacterized protein n=1 Tax=uncultured Caudovirales phage TaxID=2100421 RepID=A0A6J5MWL3_9CAUD|nr:hypothetical protein UFOVP556_5 [uncultured Caudovirales phage]
MSLPTMQVLVGFQSTTGFGTPFLLNDAFYGVLNTTGRGTLGGVTMVDLTSIVESVNITRGRSRQLDQFNAGTATIAFNNKTQVLNPTNTSSPYYPFVLPRCPVQVLANGVPIYTGLVTDWNLDYDISNQDMMYASCADQFTVLANQALNAVTPSAQASGDRINTVLSYSEINYQGARAIDTGSSTLGAYTIAQDTNVLNYLQLINTSEQGYLFMSANGTLTFKGRSSVLNPVAGATFNTTGTGLPYQTLVNQYGDELLYNYIVTQSPAGAKQTASNATSIALYQSQQYALMDLLNSTTTEVAGLGNYLLGKYQNPVLRFTGLSTQMAALSTANQNIILGLDLTSICTVVKNFVTGTPSTETQTLIVSGVSHNITSGSHIVSYTFESTDGNQYLTLNNSIFGTLNENLLAF